MDNLSCYVNANQYQLPQTWNAEVSYFLGKMDCNYYLDIRQCKEDPEEANYEDFVNLESTRLAAHVGDIPFGAQSGTVYNKLIADIFVSQKETIEFLLERYQVSLNSFRDTLYEIHALIISFLRC